MTINLSESSYGGCGCSIGREFCDCGLECRQGRGPSREQIKPLPILNMTAGEALAYAVCIVLTIGICMLKAWDWWTP